MQKATYREIHVKEWLVEFSHLWYQGEHVALMGQTGSGKSTVMLQGLKIRQYVVAICIKPMDDILYEYRNEGYKIVRRVDDIVTEYPLLTPYRVVLWVPPKSLSESKEQSREIKYALEYLYQSGKWCIFLDDIGHVTGKLGLKQEVSELLNQGRSSGISIVSAMTQPRSINTRIPTESFKQCRHIIVFRYTDTNEIRACAEISGITFSKMRDMQLMLHEYDFLYINRDIIMLVRNTN